MYLASEARGDPIIVGTASELTKTVVVAIGNSDYHEPIVRLQYGASDANRFADVFRQQGAVVHRIINASRSTFRDAVESALGEVADSSLLIFYYSGHAVIDSGKFWLLPVDANIEKLRLTGISTTELNEIIRRAPASVKMLFLDTEFSGMAVDAL